MALAVLPELPAALARPAIVEPAPSEASFGRIAGTVSPGTHRVVVVVDGVERGAARVKGTHFELRVVLPPRDATVEVRAEDALGNSALTTVGPVLGLGSGASPAARPATLDRRLEKRLRRLADGFDGICAIYVEHVRTGAGAAWNAGARFPAASTVKTAIAVETLRILADRPPPGAALDALLRSMLTESSNEAANELLRWIGGSDVGGAQEVSELFGTLGLDDSRLFEGFAVETAAGAIPIPVRVEEEPPAGGKHTTAWDLARLYRWLHLAAAGEGPLLELNGSFTSADARYVLWILAHSADRGKLDRYAGAGVLVPHKGGWVSNARHDAGLVYARAGGAVVVVLTWTSGEAGAASDTLAARVGRLALGWLRAHGDGRQAADAPFSVSL
jgi:beta-lactamase class A